MPGDSGSSANRWRGAPSDGTPTTPVPRRMSWSRSFRLSLVIVVILGLPLLMVNAIPHARGHQRTIRLCSKNLSDALYLVCRDRGGYNEPFAYSGEESVRASSGGGLVEECCYRSCSLEQLEQYCKPAPDDKIGSQDGIEESLRIVNLPYTSTRELATERRSGTAAVGDNNESPEKSKHRKKARVKKLDCNATRGRKHGYHAERGLKAMKISGAGRRSSGKRVRARPIGSGESNDDDVNDDAREASIRECRRRRRWRRRHRGKALREAAAAKVPEFKVGTTLPEPKDSLLLFPSRLHNVFQEASLDLAGVEDIENLEKFNSLDAMDRHRNTNRGINRVLAIGYP